tara:strand:- start:7526 stop:8467 length:942 start_codon:yes stop_codon:yes gene_type:complete
MKNKILFWVTDFSTKSGEGLLAIRFINDLKSNTNLKVIRIDNRKLISKFKKNTITHKYILPILGIWNLWLAYFKGYKTCYVNYLPLWNFLIFFILPPKTILGPITGTISKHRSFVLKRILEIISRLIINIRYKKCLFANNFYKSLFTGHYHNYIIKNLNFKIYKKKKITYDFLFYYRKQYDKELQYLNLIINLTKLNFKIAIIGDKLLDKNVSNFGYVNTKKLELIMKKTKSAINNKENLYSFFAQKCLINNLSVFYNDEFIKYEKLKIKNFYPIPYNNLKMAINLILRKKNLSILKNQNIKLNFNNYFFYDP